MTQQIFGEVVNRCQWNEELVRFYAANRFVLLRDFISPVLVRQFLELRSHLESKVYSGTHDPAAAWRTDHVPEGHWLNDDIRGSKLIEHVNAFADNVIASDKLRIWYMDYEQGSFVDKHTEKAGSILMVVCLRGVDAGEGGTLHLCPGAAEHRLQLASGEAVFFSGSSVPHYTSPIVATATNPNPRRTVFVVRFF